MSSMYLFMLGFLLLMCVRRLSVSREDNFFRRCCRRAESWLEVVLKERQLLLPRVQAMLPLSKAVKLIGVSEIKIRLVMLLKCPGKLR